MTSFYTFKFKVTDPAKVRDITSAVLSLPGGIVKAVELHPVAIGSPKSTWSVSVKCFVASCVAHNYDGPPLATNGDLVQALRDCVGPGIALVRIPHV